ncbi:MAG: hypothetical protein A2066_12835 [Bacteroidetes bacterium GWB2_41_8]|nr:MAG: hypothetical protein A2066_12835 [Bacteroidetes bacterium GWB2_41_8]
MIEQNIIDGSDYMPEFKAIFLTTPSRDLFTEPDSPITVDAFKIAPWGEDNDLPAQIITKAEKSEIVEANLLFNIQAGYGQGIKPMRRIIENGKIVGYDEIVEGPVVDFFEQNDINGFFLEQLTDLHHFYNVFPEIILSGDKRQIVSLRSKEATFSRWGTMDPKLGRITKHYYSAKWADGPNKNNVVATDVLDSYNPFLDLTSRISTGNYSALRFIVPVNFPTPGRQYYQRPYWWSIFQSGWYDFATMIPEFKKALLKNQMAIKYIVYLSDKYWDVLFQQEGINATDQEAVKNRKALEFDNFKKFLSGEKNAGKGLVALKKMIASGSTAIEEKYIEIVPLKTEIQGGEYIEDSGEVNSIISYAMGVDLDMPGKKTGGMSGTDKRERFQIKQALMKPLRDRLLKPLLLIKQFNKWEKDIVFAIPEPVFTTLDKNKTGQETAVNK